MYLILIGSDMIYKIQGCVLQKNLLLRHEFFGSIESF